MHSTWNPKVCRILVFLEVLGCYFKYFGVQVLEGYIQGPHCGDLNISGSISVRLSLQRFPYHTTECIPNAVATIPKMETRHAMYFDALDPTERWFGNSSAVRGLLPATGGSGEKLQVFAHQILLGTSSLHTSCRAALCSSD